MTEDAIKAQLEALERSMDKGFAGVDKRLDKLDYSVEAVHKEGLPRRTYRLEQWRDALNGRVWRLLIGITVAVIAAWTPVILQSGVNS